MDDGARIPGLVLGRKIRRQLRDKLVWILKVRNKFLKKFDGDGEGHVRV